MTTANDEQEDQRAMGMLQSAMNFREIFVKEIYNASPESLSTICECLLEYTKLISEEHGRPVGHYLYGAANPATDERFSDVEAMGFIALNDVIFNQSKDNEFREGMAAASGLQAMATFIHAGQVARSQQTKLAILSKKYEMSRIIDLTFKMDRENRGEETTN